MILGELVERVYRAIHTDIVDGVATGGTATTIIDSALSTQSFTENRFKNWIAIITRSTDGASPQNKYGIATAYVKSTGTITIPTVTATVDSGDRYALCKPDIPLYTMESLCNDALRSLGKISVWDTSMTTGTTATKRYTMPLAAKGQRIRELYLRGTTSTFLTYDVPNYYVENSAGGTQGTLVFEGYPLASQTIVFNYLGYHPAMTTYASYINETIHDELALATCVERVYNWRVKQKQKPIDQKNWNMAKAGLEEAKRMFPIERNSVENKRVPVGIYNSSVASKKSDAYWLP